MARQAAGVGGGWLVLAMSLCWAAPGAAQSGQAFRLEYWASGRCPDALEFARQIQTRAPRLRPAVADEPALGFYVEIAEREGSATGRLTARSADGREVAREVRGPTCDDVATALALIAALAADPNQAVDAPAREPTRRPKRKPRSKPPAEDEEREPEPEADPSGDLPDSVRRWTFAVGGGLAFDSSIAPSPGYGLNIAFDAEGRRGSPWRPLFSLAALRAAAANTETTGGSASFTWLAFRASACPLRVPEDTPLFVRPCAFVDAGVLGAELTASSGSRDQSQSWLAAGGFLRIEALTAQVVSFQLDGGVTVPLRRPSFSASDQAPEAFRVPTSGILGRIGLSYRFQ